MTNPIAAIPLQIFHPPGSAPNAKKSEQINRAIGKLLLQSKWNPTALSTEERRFYAANKDRVTKAPPLHYFWTHKESVQERERMAKCLAELPSLQKISLAESRNLSRKVIENWLGMKGTITDVDESETAAFYTRILQTHQIREIAISFPITPKVLQALTAEPNLSSFTLLMKHDYLSQKTLKFHKDGHIEQSDVYDRDIISAVRGLKKLEKLTLQTCGLRDQHIAIIAQENSHIATLDLSTYKDLEKGSEGRVNQFTVSGLMPLSACIQLREMSLQNAIDSDGQLAETLLEAAPSLEVLDLRGCIISPDEIPLFGQFPRLQRLMIGNYRNSQQLAPAVEKLRAEKPKLSIEFT